MTGTSPKNRRSLIRDSRCAWICWAVFALVIAADVLRRDTLVETSDGRQLLGKVVSQTPETLTLRVEHRTDGAKTTELLPIPRSSVTRIVPYAARSVTPEYRRAAELWWRRLPLYTEGVHGFLYLPQAAIAYTPFDLLPGAPQEILWRWVNIGVYGAGLWQLSRLLFPRSTPLAFTLATLLAIPAAIGSASNGQTNLVMGGLFALAAAGVIEKRWWSVTAWLMLALACKPTAAVMILLVGAVYFRPMAWRLAAGLVAFAIVPFLHPDTSYVLEQYRLCLAKMASAAAPPDRFQDIRGMLMDFGMTPDAWPRVVLPFKDGSGATRSIEILTLVRAAAAALTLGLCWLSSRRFREPAGAVLLLTFGMIYLMLFNPRTEGVTYAMLGIPAALWSTRELLDRRWAAAVPLVVFCLILQFSMLVTGGKNYWVRPVTTIAFAAYVGTLVIRGKDRWGFAVNRDEAAPGLNT